MASVLLLLLSVLGCVCVGGARKPTHRSLPELPEQSSWMGFKVELIKRFLEKARKDEHLGEEVEALKERLNRTDEALQTHSTQLQELRQHNNELQTRLNTAEEEIQKLKQSNAAPRVAFSASLVDSGEAYQGPSDNRTLVFKRVFSNIGDGYDSNTGVFTAPVPGFYYFTISSFGYGTHTGGAILLKNGVRQVSTYEHPSSDGSDGGANGAVLQLAAGDQLKVELWEDGRVYDNLNGHNTFSGFLLFGTQEN